MSRAVVVGRPAHREFDEAVSWYEQRRVGLGNAFSDEVDRVLALAAAGPERFPMVHRDV